MHNSRTAPTESAECFDPEDHHILIYGPSLSASLVCGVLEQYNLNHTHHVRTHGYTVDICTHTYMHTHIQCFKESRMTYHGEI